MRMDSRHFAHSSPVKRKVLGDINNTAESPISPTANLKLLTKVASQYDAIENNLYSVKGVVGTPPSTKQDKAEIEETKFNPQVKGVRKFKSLGFLCDKFLMLYPLDVPEDGNSRILLTHLASQLGVEKRRVYDIINVVESLQMAIKIGKNSYSWTGHKKLAGTLSQLKSYAEQVGLLEYVRKQQFSRNLYLGLHNGEVEPTESSLFTQNPSIASFFRNERRIGILCQKFVMLFLVSLKDGLINLDLAADVLVGEDCQQNKTRLRRLYDIANILVSLGIITKLDLGAGWKKPLFRYVGPPIDSLDDINSDSSSSVLSNLVKAELSDGTSSDLSEDSSEVSWQSEDTNLNRSSVTQTDHSYSLDLRNEEKPSAAKKRLVFSTNSVNKVVLCNKKSLNVVPVQAKSSTLLRVLGHGSVSQPIKNGGVYKAVRVGNDMQLIRIDSS